MSLAYEKRPPYRTKAFYLVELRGVEPAKKPADYPLTVDPNVIII
jgi:hypothetical protein